MIELVRKIHELLAEFEPVEIRRKQRSERVRRRGRVRRIRQRRREARIEGINFAGHGLQCGDAQRIARINPGFYAGTIRGALG